MPTEIQCPTCRKILRAPDGVAGKRVQCPNCQSSIVVPPTRETGIVARPVAPTNVAPASAHPAAATSPFDFDQPSPWAGMDPDAPRELPSGWGTVRLGLALMSWGTLLYGATGLLLGFMLGVASLVDMDHGSESPLFLVSMMPALLAGPLMLIGMGLCLATPSQSGLHGMILGAFICMFCFSAIGAVLFLLFLRDVANYFRNKALARQIVFFLCLGVAVPVLSCCIFSTVMDLIGPGTSQSQQAARGVVMAALGVPFLGLVLWLWYLLRATRASITAENRWGRAYG